VTLRRSYLWLSFLVVHLLLVFLNMPDVTKAYTDVLRVYPSWLAQGLDGTWVGVDVPWVYPLLAWLPILVSGAFGPHLLPTMWLAMMTVLDAVAFASLLRARRGEVLAWTWLGLLIAAGPIAIGRLDGVATAVAIVGFAMLRNGRPGLAAAVWTTAAWMKVWPGVLYLALLVVRRERGTVLSAGALVSAAVLLVAALLGSQHALSFLLQQDHRGLQIESVGATPFMWMAMAGDAHVYFHDGIVTFQVSHPGAGAVAAFSTPVLIAAVGAVCALGLRAVRRTSAHEATAWLALALVSTLIVTNKVGSPQFVLWLAVPALLLAERGRTRHWIAVSAIALVSLLTQLQYPLTYHALVAAELFGVLLLTARNALHVMILIGAVVMLARSARGGTRYARLSWARAPLRAATTPREPHADDPALPSTRRMLGASADRSVRRPSVGPAPSPAAPV
jgi:hypothetical protein